jgi:hypothetical protein
LRGTLTFNATKFGGVGSAQRRQDAKTPRRNKSC